jgi:hypothetical protein
MTTVKDPLGPLFSPAGIGGGSGNSEIPAILKKMETFARKVIIKEYGIEEDVASKLNLIFPITGINHLITRGIFQPLERMNSGIKADTEILKFAGSAAEKAAEDPDFFFENANNIFDEETVARFYDCIRISSLITNAEVESNPIQSAITKADLQKAELTLRNLTAGIQRIAQDNPDISGLQEFAEDIGKVQNHFSSMSRDLLPKLNTSRTPVVPQKT